MSLIQVEFHDGGQRYTYQAHEHVAVGEMVMVPTSNPFVGETTGVAKVVALGSDFKGKPKTIIGIYREAADDES